VLLGLVPRGEVVSGIGHIYVELFNGILWGVVYGSLGFLVDRFRGAYPRRVA
jgi:F0F1-type ATP synthase assembly protein I